MEDTMRTIIISIGIALAVGACGNQTGDAKGKTEIARKDGKDGKTEGKGKSDAKAETKAQPDAKSPDSKADPDSAGSDTPPPQGEGGDELDAAKIGELARLAREITAKPDDAEALLEKAGMDRPAFEAAMVAVAKDPWKTDLYVTALTQADGAG
jgi:hypothetical protein